jgi:hypothetical protein
MGLCAWAQRGGGRCSFAASHVAGCHGVHALCTWCGRNARCDGGSTTVREGSTIPHVNRSTLGQAGAPVHRLSRGSTAPNPPSTVLRHQTVCAAAHSAATSRKKPDTHAAGRLLTCRLPRVCLAWLTRSQVPSHDNQHGSIPGCMPDCMAALQASCAAAWLWARFRTVIRWAGRGCKRSRADVVMPAK